jgi:hypothetical protein
MRVVELVADRGGLLLQKISHHDASAFADKSLGDRPPDALRRPGDDGDF